MPKTLRWVLVTLFVVLTVGGCGTDSSVSNLTNGNPSGPAVVAEGAAEVPGLYDELSATPPTSYTGKAFTPPKGVSSNNILVGGPAERGQLGDEYTWARFAVAYSNVYNSDEDDHIQPRPVRLQASPSGTGEFWIGISNYSAMKWQWFEKEEAVDVQLNAMTGDEPHICVSLKEGHKWWEHPNSWVSALTGEALSNYDDGYMHIVVVAKGVEAAEDAVDAIIVTDLIPSDPSYNQTVPQPTAIEVTVGSTKTGKGVSTIYADENQLVHIEWDQTFDPGGGDTVLNYPSWMHIWRRQIVNGTPVSTVSLGVVPYVSGGFIDPTNVQNPDALVPMPGAFYKYRTYAETPGQVRTLDGETLEISMPVNPPVDVTANLNGDGDVVVQWRESFGMTAYDVYRSDDLNNRINLQDIPNDPDEDYVTWTDPDPLQNQVSTYRVKAKNDYGISDFSDAAPVAIFDWTKVNGFGLDCTGSKTGLGYITYGGSNQAVVTFASTNEGVTDLKCAIAAGASPQTSADFNVSTVVGNVGTVYSLSLLTYGATSDKILVLYSTEGGGLKAALSNGPAPDDPTDWTITTIDAEPTAGRCLLDVALVAGKPATVYDTANKINIRYCASVDANPDLDADWTNGHRVAGGPSGVEYTDINLIGLSDNKPYFGLSGRTNNLEVRLCYANQVDPTQESHWTRFDFLDDAKTDGISILLDGATTLRAFTIAQNGAMTLLSADTIDLTTWTSSPVGSLSSVGGRAELMLVNGKLVASGDFGSGGIGFKFAGIAAPDGPEDWARVTAPVGGDAVGASSVRLGTSRIGIASIESGGLTFTYATTQ